MACSEGRLYIDHAFESDWFLGDQTNIRAEAPAINVVLSGPRRPYRWFVPLRVPPHAAGVYDGFVLTRGIANESTNETTVDSLKVRMQLCWPSGQLYQSTSGLFGLPRRLGGFGLSTAVSLGVAKAAYSSTQTGPYFTYFFSCDHSCQIDAGAYWVQVLMEMFYAGEGRAMFRGVSRQPYDYLRSGQDSSCGRSYRAHLPASMATADMMDGDALDYTLFSGTLSNPQMDVSLRTPSAGSDALSLAIGVMGR